MGKINKVNKQTTNPYLNLYDLDVVNKVGREGHYYVAVSYTHLDVYKRQDQNRCRYFLLFSDKYCIFVP